jgi:hypothetical protein
VKSKILVLGAGVLALGIFVPGFEARAGSRGDCGESAALKFDKLAQRVAVFAEDVIRPLDAALELYSKQLSGCRLLSVGPSAGGAGACTRFKAALPAGDEQLRVNCLDDGSVQIQVCHPAIEQAEKEAAYVAAVMSKKRPVWNEEVLKADLQRISDAASCDEMNGALKSIGLRLDDYRVQHEAWGVNVTDALGRTFIHEHQVNLVAGSHLLDAKAVINRFRGMTPMLSVSATGLQTQVVSILFQ